MLLDCWAIFLIPLREIFRNWLGWTLDMKYLFHLYEKLIVFVSHFSSRR